MMHASQHTIRLRPPPPFAVPMHAPTHTVRMRRELGPTCLNCDAVLSGKFCSDCGQAAKTPKRITFGAILHELPHAILHLEHALPHTIVALLRRPGHAARDYLAGKRAHVYSPFSLLFLLSGLVGLATLTLNLKGAIVVTSNGGDLGARIAKGALQYRAWVQLLFLPLLAIGPTLVLRGRTGLRYAEQVVAMAMFAAGSAVVSLLVLPLKVVAVKAAVPALSSVAEASTTLYMLWAYAQLQADGKTSAVRRWTRAFGAMIASVSIFLLVLLLAVIAGALIYAFVKSRHLV